jgi:hypothetical protein
VYRVAVWVAPVVVGVLVHRLLVGLQRSEEVEEARRRALAEAREAHPDVSRR